MADRAAVARLRQSRLYDAALCLHGRILSGLPYPVSRYAAPVSDGRHLSPLLSVRRPFYAGRASGDGAGAGPLSAGAASARLGVLPRARPWHGSWARDASPARTPSGHLPEGSREDRKSVG